MIRLFTAIGLPQTVATRLSFMQGGIPGARWSPIENLHLTLRFIGEVEQTTARDVDGVLSTIHASAFSLRLHGVGEFGGKEPHAIWAGVAPSENLFRLHSKIESALQRMGHSADTRKFTPHVTLSRLRDAPASKVAEFIAAHSLFDSGVFQVTTFGLFSSHASSHGSHYVLESEYALEN